MAIKPIVKEAVVALVVLGMTISVATNSPATEPFPATRIYQKDGAWRVDYLSGSPLEVYSDGDRMPRFRLWIEDALPAEEYERFVSRTTAGPEWASFALHYFITMDEKPHFCARTWWGRRILIDLIDLRQVSDSPHERILRAAEQSWILDGLAAAVKRPPSAEDEQGRAEIQRTKTAIYQAGRLQVTEAAALLRQLELSPYPGGVGILDDRGLKSGDIHPCKCEIYTVRQMAQKSLRGLGQKPREDLPATLFRYLTPEPDSGTLLADRTKPYKPRTYASSRHSRVADLSEGMKPVQVLDALGPPDDLIAHREQWRYDIDAEPPYSLLVTWKDDWTVATLEAVKPPLWMQTDRMEEHARPVAGGKNSHQRVTP